MRTIETIDLLDATVTLPGSKSYTQRALVIGALAEGETVLRHGLVSDDSTHLTEALQLLGARIATGPEEIRIQGTGGRIAQTEKPILLGNNGTALRFLTSLVSIGMGRYVLSGSPRLGERPVKPLLDALKDLGVASHTEGEKGFPPVTIEAQGIRGGMVRFHNTDSSQYISSLLISAPYAKGDVHIVLSGRTVSRPYIEMTVETMGHFGAEVGNDGRDAYTVKSGQFYRGTSYTVEGDASSASYFFLAGALCGGRIRVSNVNPRSRQGDIRFLDIIEQLGCHVLKGEDWVEVGRRTLRGDDMTIDMGDMPDMVPTVAVLSAFRQGTTQITRVPHLRIKESNRIEALVRELNRIGVSTRETADGLIIRGGDPQGAEIETYNDHRIAMSFAIAGLRTAGMKISNPSCVNKSFPDFWRALDGLYARTS